MGVPPAQKDLFVSYAHREPDESWVQTKLVPALRRSGLSVLLDKDDFVVGQPLRGEMARAVRECRYVLAVLSPAYDTNRMAGPEAFEAMQAGRLVPIIVRPTKPPAWMQELIWQDWTRSNQLQRNWKNLLKSLGAKYPQAAPPEPIDSRRVWPILAAVAALLILGLVAPTVLSRWNRPQESIGNPQPAGTLTPSPKKTDDVLKAASTVVSKSKPPKEDREPSSPQGTPKGPEISNPVTSALDVRVQAFDLAERGRCDEAIPLLERVASTEPRDGQVFFQLGRCEESVGNSAAAREHIARAEELGESPAKTASELGAIALAADDINEARRQIDRALAAQPAYPAALLVRGDLFLKQRKYPDAIEVFYAVFERTHSAESCRKLADAYGKNGAAEQAESQRALCGAAR